MSVGLQNRSWLLASTCLLGWHISLGESPCSPGQPRPHPCPAGLALLQDVLPMATLGKGLWLRCAAGAVVTCSFPLGITHSDSVFTTRSPRAAHRALCSCRHAPAGQADGGGGGCSPSTCCRPGACLPLRRILSESSPRPCSVDRGFPTSTDKAIGLPAP